MSICVDKKGANVDLCKKRADVKQYIQETSQCRSTFTRTMPVWMCVYKKLANVDLCPNKTHKCLSVSIGNAPASNHFHRKKRKEKKKKKGEKCQCRCLSS